MDLVLFNTTGSEVHRTPIHTPTRCLVGNHGYIWNGELYVWQEAPESLWGKEAHFHQVPYAILLD